MIDYSADASGIRKEIEMAEIKLGRVKSGSGKTFVVKWNPSSKDVYVDNYGWTHVGKANSAGEAMTRAEAWAYNK